MRSVLFQRPQDGMYERGEKASTCLRHSRHPPGFVFMKHRSGSVLRLRGTRATCRRTRSTSLPCHGMYFQVVPLGPPTVEHIKMNGGTVIKMNRNASGSNTERIDFTNGNGLMPFLGAMSYL